MDTNVQNYGVSPMFLLFLLFLGLKLTGVIAWPWVWVTAPLWAPLALFLVGSALTFTVILLIAWLRD